MKKVTALIPDKLIQQVKQLSQSKTITEGLVVALEEWVKLQKLRQLNSTVDRSPLVFDNRFDAQKIRALNRK